MDATAIKDLQNARDKMRLDCMEIGEPCVEIPMDSISVYKDDSGDWHALIPMCNLIQLVDIVLRQHQ